MKNRKIKRRTGGKRRPGYGKAMLPALVAVGGGLAGAPAAALELGQIVVHSKIGQPLRASVVYALGPNEVLDSYCVSVRSGGIGSDLPGIAKPSVRIADGKITITGRNPVMEPMITANLTVKCPYTPHIVRDYLMFIDPAGTVPEKMESAPADFVAADMPVAEAPSPAVAAVRNNPVVRTPIQQATQYLVQPGDSLSAIAMRLEDRDADLQSAMDLIYDANPDAFINGDPNLIQAGSTIDIPGVTGLVARDDAYSSNFDMEVSEPVDETAYDSYTDSSVYQGAESTPNQPQEEPAPVELDTRAYEPAFESTDEATFEATTPVSDVAEPEVVADDYADLVPGDLIVNEPVADQTADAGIADATEYVETSEPQIIPSPEPAEASNWNWLIWIVAGALTLLGGILLIGPRLRASFGSKPVGGSESELRPISEHAAPRTPSISVPEPTMAVEEISPERADVDFDLSDDSPTEENLALDADLIAGTGLEQSDDVQVNQDFGFAATTDLDLELTEQAVQEDEPPETDIIPPPERPSEDLIVEETESADDTEYDMSVIVDATKMPDPRDVTERDLKAVPLDDTGQTPIADAYTIDQGVDLEEVLEQDYEDEFTATQALNQEIEQAAAELANNLDDTVEAAGDTSVEVQLANLSDLDLTATLEAQNDDMDVTAKIEADDETVEMPSKGKGGA